MDSAALHHPSRQPAAGVSAETEYFFDALRSEHERVLAAVRRACSHLDPAPGSLAAYSATHVRLLQRFLDAQRGLLRRRAESDRVVGVIRAEAEEAARSTLAAAHAEAVARMMRRALVAAHSGADDHPLLAEWDRIDGENSALGPMSGYLDVAGFNRIIDDELPFGHGASDAMLTELSQLLDDWWQAEQQQAGGHAELATARAALLERLVTIEAHEIAEAAGPLPLEAEAVSVLDSAPAAMLPADVLAVLDAADATALDDLLAGCVDLLGGGPAESAVDQEQEAAPGVRCIVEQAVDVLPDGEGPLLRFSESGSFEIAEAMPAAEPVEERVPSDVVVPTIDASAGPSLASQVFTVALRVVAPITAFSVVFALLAWLVG